MEEEIFPCVSKGVICCTRTVRVIRAGIRDSIRQLSSYFSQIRFPSDSTEAETILYGQLPTSGMFRVYTTQIVAVPGVNTEMFIKVGTEGFKPEI